MAAAESNVPATNQVVVESNDTEDDGITLMDLFRIVHKHLLVGIITFVVVFAAVCAYTFLAPPKYSATAQVFATYSDSSVQDNNISNINSASTYITNQIQSYPTLATTESVLKPVIDDLGLDTTVANLARAADRHEPDEHRVREHHRRNGRREAGFRHCQQRGGIPEQWWWRSRCMPPARSRR